MGKKRRIFLTLLILFFLMGSISAWLHRARTDYYPIYQEVYPALRADIAWLTSLIKKDYDPLLTGVEPLVFTLALLNVPFATVFDTILIPYDIFQTQRNKRYITKLLNKYLYGLFNQLNLFY